jgi:hypothetical protein
MLRNIVAAGLATFLGAAALPAEESDGPAKDVPELKVLSNYVGTWDVEMNNGQPVKGQATAQWILGGRFVEQTGSLHSADGKLILQIRTLMTWDPKQKAYRSWTFASNGFVGEGRGTWNPETRTMTSISRIEEADQASTTTADFSQAGIEKWSIVIKDESGDDVSEVKGTNTRREK